MEANHLNQRISNGAYYLPVLLDFTRGYEARCSLARSLLQGKADPRDVVIYLLLRWGVCVEALLGRLDAFEQILNEQPVELAKDRAKVRLVLATCLEPILQVRVRPDVRCVTRLTMQSRSVKNGPPPNIVFLTYLYAP